MRDVIYFGSISVDGYIDAADGDSRWVVPDPELHRHFNELERSIGAHLYGRRMYELMAEFWPTADVQPAAPGYIVDYAADLAGDAQGGVLQDARTRRLEL